MSAASAAAAAASISYKNSNSNRESNQAPNHRWVPFYTPSSPQQPVLNRYETRKRNDWNAFMHHLKKLHRSLILSRCTGVIMIEFLDDQFGNIKTHSRNCPFLEKPDSAGSCSFPLMQAWSSLDGLAGRHRNHLFSLTMVHRFKGHGLSSSSKKNAADLKNDQSDYLIEEGLNNDSVVLKCAEIQTAIPVKMN